MAIHDNDARWRLAIRGGAGMLLLLPWLAMQFTREVAWDATDFVAFGAMLALAAGACEIALRMSSGWRYRLASGVAVGTAFLTVWANLAVGMIGNEHNPANLMFAAVLLVAALGALVARYRARGMAMAMVATAVAQVGATVLAVLLSGWDRGFLPALCFALPWLVAAALFQAAARWQASRHGQRSAS